MKFTVIIPEAPPINKIGENVTYGNLYGTGDFTAENTASDIILELTGQQQTTYISLKTGDLYPSLPSSATILPNGSEVVLEQGDLN